jgi:hypothetical protein
MSQVSSAAALSVFIVMERGRIVATLDRGRTSENVLGAKHSKAQQATARSDPEKHKRHDQKFSREAGHVRHQPNCRRANEDAGVPCSPASLTGFICRPTNGYGRIQHMSVDTVKHLQQRRALIEPQIDGRRGLADDKARWDAPRLGAFEEAIRNDSGSVSGFFLVVGGSLDVHKFPELFDAEW